MGSRQPTRPYLKLGAIPVSRVLLAYPARCSTPPTPSDPRETMAPTRWIRSLLTRWLPVVAAALLAAPAPADAQGCGPAVYPTTAEAIQDIIFDSGVYACSTTLCHNTALPSGMLDLTSGISYGQLIGVPAFANPAFDRVEPGEPALSFLYLKLRWATEGIPVVGGGPMPSGGPPPLTADHLEAIRLWIRGGAPTDLVVEGTAELLGTCLPPPDPLIIPVPDPPPVGTGVQVHQTPWPLPAAFEDEICMSTWYDFTAPGIVPASATVPCPALFLNLNNPSGECFAYLAQTLWQDPQSHHSIIHIYTGAYADSHPNWGAYTYKFQDPNDPNEGMACDKKAVGPLGFNPNCSGAAISSIACIGYGPPDVSQGGAGGTTTPAFSGSQEPFVHREFPDGVYSILPKQGIIIWNGHAFNLTASNSTMSQYVNIEFAGPLDQVFPAQGIFDSASIFVQQVQPFQTREYCRSYTVPPGTRLYGLGSHTHRHGVFWRTWLPPNESCVPGQPACIPKIRPPIYTSTDYSDPLDLFFDPSLVYDGDVGSRTLLYCSVYDNGAGPASPPVKLQSTSPEPPLVFGLPLGPGGPCSDSEVVCVDGPNKGVACGANDAFCDSAPAAGDGDCDACLVLGGVTTEDEMFILLGGFYQNAGGPPATVGDQDGDTVLDGSDNCPTIPNTGQEDTDGDSRGDACDNCPFRVNPANTDTGSAWPGYLDDLGDVCQCGDVSVVGTVHDGIVDAVDITQLRDHLAGVQALTALGAAKCSVIGGPDDCDIQDLVVIRRANNFGPLQPGILGACREYVGP